MGQASPTEGPSSLPQPASCALPRPLSLTLTPRLTHPLARMASRSYCLHGLQSIGMELPSLIEGFWNLGSVREGPLSQKKDFLFWGKPRV